MAMINCPECNNNVSNTAFKCPSCGTQLRKPKRGFFGKLFKWSFVLFNILMFVWLVGGMNAATKGYESLNGAEQAGAAIGTTLGAAMIVGIWVIGDIVLGLFVLFTRPKAA
ncbi:zinc ribbon domain-containing protein [Rhizobium sp. CB3060]|uniref:zinc ribbon domain-containing protein n=1 Tax=Rhizobium sp. CB3060 TaxID=3138255 RepID=UPI0021A78CBA|nr:zinc ribbon domain-containing protein [Rhizobium tropici]UWU20157.1 zinc ribbon domain-containing protein [Rhizobium tropici]